MSKNKVTIEDVRANMQDVITRTVVEFGKPVTYVSVRMKNGFTVRESTTCVDPSNYSEKTGVAICLQKIEDKIWMLLGYELQSKIAYEKEAGPKKDTGKCKCDGDSNSCGCKSREDIIAANLRDAIFQANLSKGFASIDEQGDLCFTWGVRL